MQVPLLDPMLIVPAMAHATRHLGFGVTCNLAYEPPYLLARRFSTLDHLTNGRIGWNIVTSWLPDAARNFGYDELPAHAERYARADDFLDVVTKLWDSWADDAVVDDRRTGRYADPERVRAINHVGSHYKVAGPLNIPRPVQGRPVLVQAGSSTTGRRFAAQFAEAIFTAHLEKSTAVEFYADIKAQASALGRKPDQVLILPGLSAIVGSTEAEAKRTWQELNELSDPKVGLERLSNRFGGHDFSHLKLDQVLSVDDFPDPAKVQAAQSRAQVITALVARERPTLRQLLHSLAGARGHYTVAGAPEQIADIIEDWFKSGAADGFNVMPPILPSQLKVFIDEVTPILKKRGLFRTDYEGRTLRDHYGLDRPPNRYFAERSEASKELLPA